MGMRYEDLPPRLQAQVREKMGGRIERGAPRVERRENRRTECVSHIEKKKKQGRRRAPNKTEADYQRHQLRGMDARFEAVTFRMANGHRYTPDWVVLVDGKPVACHECKGGYTLHSQQRARLAFDQVRVEFPGLVWVWAVKTSAGWQVTTL